MSSKPNNKAAGVHRSKEPEGEMSEAEIDYNVMGTFPASDPPSWTLGISPHKRSAEEFDGEKPSANEPTHQNEPSQEDDVSADD